MFNLYDKLREAENLQDIKTILISDISLLSMDIYENRDFIDTVKDKLTRCT